MGDRAIRRISATDVHVLAVQTAPRPNGSSLAATLTSIEAAGLERWRGPRLLVADGYIPDAFPGVDEWVTYSGAPVQGSARTFLRLLRGALGLAPDLARLTYLQDDVCLARNALDYIDSVVVPDDVMLISWFSIWLEKREDPHACFVEMPIGPFNRSQAITIPRLTIDLILSSQVIAKWPIEHGCDRFFAKMGSTENAIYLAHYPSIVQHTEGLNSACGLKHSKYGERKAPSFVGEDFDAQLLWPEMIFGGNVR